jgi:hypothetical protein
MRPAGAICSEASIARAYLCAKREILSSGYRAELLGVERSPADVTEKQFLRELAWVILSSGMAEIVIRNKFADISTSFLEWQSARSISDRAQECVASALRHFRHEGKIRAIASAATTLSAARSFEEFKQEMLCDPIQRLQSFAYIGPTTVFHIAKNIGVRVAKPDRHLTRLARSSGFESVAEFCGTIAGFLGEDIRLVDSVLWRFATLHDDCAAKFSRFMAA